MPLPSKLALVAVCKSFAYANENDKGSQKGERFMPNDQFSLFSISTCAFFLHQRRKATTAFG